MDEVEIVHRISQLVEDEHALERSHAGAAPSDDEVERLKAIEVALDQCWDLLRQRRARRDAGQDPDDASVRPERTVEGYQQ
ncbi:MAG: hypothetical protein QOC92_3049 [Acidimicrobiaceae bacterium]|jgi:hypothetical protein